jgi:aryl sulfotransferase
MPTLSRAPLRDYATVVLDSHRWDGFAPRADDIVIATFSKCGTTWMQRIVDLLVFRSPEPRPVTAMAPWLDATFVAPIPDVLAMLDAQTHRRFVKTHLPFDALPVWDEVKYIHVVRDGRDAALSMQNHQRGMKPDVTARFAEVARETGRRNIRATEIAADPRDYFRQWLDVAEKDGAGGDEIGYFAFENSYWHERMRPNLLFVHYNDLKADLEGEMRRIADFLAIDVAAELWPALVHAARFDSMKRDGETLLQGMGSMFDHGAERFLHRGANERWRDVLGQEDVARYEALMGRKWTANQAAYMLRGRLEAGNVRTL